MLVRSMEGRIVCDSLDADSFGTDTDREARRLYTRHEVGEKFTAAFERR